MNKDLKEKIEEILQANQTMVSELEKRTITEELLSLFKSEMIKILEGLKEEVPTISYTQPQQIDIGYGLAVEKINSKLDEEIRKL